MGKTGPKPVLDHVKQLAAVLERRGIGRIASVMGRYYAMDRDNRWDRVEKAWQAIVLGHGVPADDAEAAVTASYAAAVTDEFVVPAVTAPAGVRDGDAVIYFKDSPDLRTADAANGAAAALVDLARLGRSFSHLRCYGAPGRARGRSANVRDRGCQRTRDGAAGGVVI